MKAVGAYGYLVSPAGDRPISADASHLAQGNQGHFARSRSELRRNVPYPSHSVKPEKRRVPKRGAPRPGARGLVGAGLQTTAVNLLGGS